ncbi:MAG: hypothetical protein JST48_08160 [Bacteroidetes bacterium]|nr:hypothetical protein [Bacteroidota bacterium]
MARLKTETVFTLFFSLHYKKCRHSGRPLQKNTVVNKKKNPDLVRNINYTVRFNKVENELFRRLLKDSNNYSQQKFIREMLTKGIVIQSAKKENRIIADKLLATLSEYRTVFRRLSSLIKAHDPSLNYHIEQLVLSIQKVIEKV